MVYKIVYPIRARNYPVIYTTIKHNKREALHNGIQNVIYNMREELPSDLHHNKTQ